MLEEQGLRKAMLMDNKTEQIIFATTPELKEAAQLMGSSEFLVLTRTFQY